MWLSVISLLFISCIVLAQIKFTQAGWSVVDGQPSMNPTLQPFQKPEFSFTPNVQALQYQYTYNRLGAECSTSPQSLCTDVITLNRPYYRYQKAMRSILPARTLVAQPTIDIANTLALNSNNAYQNAANLSSTVAQSDRFVTLSNKAVELGMALTKDFSPAAMRRLLGFNEDFAQCGDNPEFCNKELRYANEVAYNDFQNQGVVNDLTRVNYGDALVVSALQAAKKVLKGLSKSIANANAVAALGVQEGAKALSVIKSEGDAQTAVSNYTDANLALISNVASNYLTIMNGIGIATIQEQAGVSAFTSLTATEQAVQTVILAQNQAQIQTFITYALPLLQIDQQLSSIVSNFAAMFVEILTQPTVARTAATATQQVQFIWERTGVDFFTDYPGEAPIVFSDLDKYQSLFQTPFFSLQPITLNKTLQGNTQQSSWVVERVYYEFICDVTFFATNMASKVTWFDAATWIGPDTVCALNPLQCVCRVHVSYQQSRHPAVLAYFIDPSTPSNTSGIISAPPLVAPLVPLVLQNSSALANALRPATFVDIYNNTLFLPAYRAKWLDSLSDLMNEQQNNCLVPILSVAQVVSPSAPDLNTADLLTVPVSSAATAHNYYMVNRPPGYNGFILPMTSAGSAYSINNTLSVRAFCQATLTNAQQFRAVDVATFTQATFSGLLKAFNVGWAGKMQSIKAWLNGGLPSRIDITPVDFAFITFQGVNDTQARRDIITMAGVSVDGVPEFHLYNRTRYVSAQVCYDPRSRMNPPCVTVDKSIIWTDGNGDSFLPESFPFVGYVECATSPCPVHVLAMSRNNVTVTTGVNDTYFYNVPPARLRHCNNPAALENNPRYIRIDYNRDDTPSLQLMETVFNGATTRLTGPSFSDFVNTAKNSLFNVFGALGANLDNYRQRTIPVTITAPVSPSDGALPVTYTTFRCTEDAEVSGDFAACTMLKLYDVLFNSTEQSFYTYPIGYNIESIPIPVPAGTTIVLPSEDDNCPPSGAYSPRHGVLSNIELTITNELYSPYAGPFQVVTSGCVGQVFAAETLGFQKSITKNIPSCDGQFIQVLSARISDPTQTVVCYSYTAVSDQVSLSTLHDSIIGFSIQIRDPVLQYTMAVSAILQDVMHTAASTLQNVFVDALFLGESSAVIQAALDRLTHLEDLNRQLNATAAGVIYGVNQFGADEERQLQTIYEQQQIANALEAQRLQDNAIARQYFAALQQSVDFSTAASQQLAEDVRVLETVILPEVDPRSYFFGSNSIFNFSDPNLDTFNVLAGETNGCLALIQVPDAGAGSERPCSVEEFKVETWMTCGLRGRNFFWRIFIYTIIILLVIVAITAAFFACGYKDRYPKCCTKRTDACCNRPADYKSPFYSMNNEQKYSSLGVPI